MSKIDINELPCYGDIKLDKTPENLECDGCEFKTEKNDVYCGANKIGTLYKCEHGYWEDEY
ncbi:hypothetical protein NVP1052A_69 [Vibrio phage 1.052.A._10N.286.46.C3]|nr:hypothetical protein NVP1052A_69 [Vibrio phage 1.052.A._10N.286.46.C3]